MGMGMGKTVPSKSGALVKSKAAERPKLCSVTVKVGTEQQRTWVDDGFDTIEVKGDNCTFVDGPPGDAALVCFLYSALLIMPVLYCLSVHPDTSDYTWVFLDSFMGIFIALLWWSWFHRDFDELEFPERVFIFVVVRCLLIPSVIYLLSDHDQLFSIANIINHICAFIAESTGTAALKFSSEGEQPSIKLLGICALVVVFDLVMWKFKNLFLEMCLKKRHPPPKARHIDRWKEVTTELGLDTSAMCLAAMLFLSVHILVLKKGDLLEKGANLNMVNTRFFDDEAEGKFAAVYSFVMFAITIIVQHFGGGEHNHQQDEHPNVRHPKGEVAKLKRDGRVNGKNITLWERVLLKEDYAASGNGKAAVELISSSVLDCDSSSCDKYSGGSEIEVEGGALSPSKEDEWRDHLLHLLQLAMMTSVSWSGLLALCALVRQHWFPFLLTRHLEGSLFVSVVLMLLSGFVIAALSVHGKRKLFSSTIMRYLRVYLLRAVSIMAALSWDMTFDAVAEDLPTHAFVSEEHESACKFFVASLVSSLIAWIYVFEMRPSMAAASALLEYKEREEMHEKED